MEHMIQLPNNGLSVLDCFCGAGVGAIGAEYAGFNTLYAFDINSHAVRNFNYNVANVAQVLDARLLDKEGINALPDTDVITGGFPCTPWSVNGKEEGKNDLDSGNLAQKLIDIILQKKPKAFLIENVKGIVSKNNLPYFLELVNQLSELFDVSWEVLDCSEYGVPQKRERVFIIGIRNDIVEESFDGWFKFPKKSQTVYSINDAISDLPELPDGINNHYMPSKGTIRNDEKPFVHKVPEGGNWKDLPIEDQKVFMKGAFNSSGGKTTFLAVMDKNKPSRTIMASPMGKNSAQILKFGDLYRRYTVRESLRLQSVPDTFGFDDETPLSVQYERCSGIPSLVSYKLMKNIGTCLI